MTIKQIPDDNRRNIRFEEDLKAQIDAARGGTSFSAWVKESCRQRLAMDKLFASFLNDESIEKLNKCLAPVRTNK